MARKQKNETPKFAVTVLWLHGKTISQIAQALDMTGGQVRGLVDRSGFSNRSEMDEQDRQLALNSLALDRKDDGMIPDRYFRVKGLRPEQVRETGQLTQHVIPGGWRKTARHPKGAVYLPSLHKPVHILPYVREMEFERRRREFYANCAYHLEFENWRIYFHQMQEVLPRDKGGNTVGGRDGRPSKKVRYGDRAKLMERDLHSAPFEWLDQRGILDQVQVDAGQRARDDLEGSQVSALKSVDWAAAGGGGFGGRPVSDYALDCQRAVAGLKRSMPPAFFKTLEDVVFLDKWIWDELTGKERKPVYDRIRVALDYAGLYYGLMPAASFERKWPDEFPWWDRRARDGERELHRSIVRAKGGNNGQ